jgi:hypothetical protein
MRNFKQPSNHALGEGLSNKCTINVLNPDDFPYKLKGKDWVNPNQPDFPAGNKTQIKTIMSKNKEAVKQKTEQQLSERKSRKSIVE